MESNFIKCELETGVTRQLPVKDGETALAHIFRLLDLLNQDQTASTKDICRDVVFTVLQCVSRTPSSFPTQEAADIVRSPDFRCILNLGVQGGLFESMHSNFKVLGPTSEDNYTQNANLIAKQRESEAQLLVNKAKLTFHIASLCRDYNSTLQIPCDSTRLNRAMSARYISLANLLNYTEKSWIVTLIPEVFQWRNFHLKSEEAGEYIDDTLVLSKELCRRINRPITSISSANPRFDFSYRRFKDESHHILLESLKVTPDNTMPEDILKLALEIKHRGEKLFSPPYPQEASEKVIGKLLNIALLPCKEKELFFQDQSEMQKRGEELLLWQIEDIKSFQQATQRMATVPETTEVPATSSNQEPNQNCISEETLKLRTFLIITDVIRARADGSNRIIEDGAVELSQIAEETEGYGSG